MSAFGLQRNFESPAEELAARLEEAVPELEDVRVLRRLTGGSSHETWAFDARVPDLGATAPAPLILRREFDHALFEMSLETEFGLLSRLYDKGLPVPRPLFKAQGDTALGSPFMIIERIAGLDTRKAMAADGEKDRAEVGKALVAALVRIHAEQPAAVSDLLPGEAHDAPARELQKWTAIIDRSGNRSVALKLAIRWLRANMRTVQQPVIVHGDFKANNILLREGRDPVIIDWELAHIGDRMEDIAWTMLWASRDDFVGGMLTPEQLLIEYERQSGMPLGRSDLRFWKLFSLVKLAAIFLKGLETSPDGAPPRPMLVMLAQALPCIEGAIAVLLQETGEECAP